MIDASRITAILEPAELILTAYVGFETSTRDVRPHAAELRRLIADAEAQLARHDLTDAQRAELLEPLRALETTDVATHRDPAIAIFARAGHAEIIPLPVTVPEMVIVGRNPHLKPLLSLLAHNRSFHILALNSSRVRLITATPYDWKERPLEAVPPSVQAELDSLVAADPAAQAAERTRLIAEDPNRTVFAVRAALGPNPGPIILVAEPQSAGHFLKGAHLPELLPDVISVNPFALSDAELHSRALAAIGPALEVEANDVLEQVQARLGTAEPDVAIRLEEILAAGTEGRVDAVIVASDETLWGRFTPGKIVAADGRRAPGDEDLINLAAVEAMRTGARAFARPKADLPRQVPAVATLRF